MGADGAVTWVEGTSADLVADALALGAQASPRMVTDWVAAGLLASPEPRKTSAHGSDPRVFSADQRQLFTRLLEARVRSPLDRVPKRSLVRVVLYVWLIDDTVVPTSQARRAWRTYASATGKQTAASRSSNVRAVVDQIAHPSASARQRRTAELVLEEVEKGGQLDWDKLTSVLATLNSPWPAQPGLPKVERALPGPFGPVTVQHRIAIWEAKQQIISHLRHEEIDEAELDRVRAAHRQDWADFQARRNSLAAGTGTLASYFAEPATFEGRAIEAVSAFVGTLAGELGLITAAFRAAETARTR